MNHTYSLHKITDTISCPFSEAEYSRFKFGDNAYAEKFADELFEGFIAQHKDLILSHNEIVILPSPYHAIPTASNFLCHYFKLRINHFLYENGRKAVSESKIYRNQTYTTDYGNLDYAERVKLIGNDTYYIDRNYIGNKLCLLLDDIKITGSHEHIVKKILNQYEVEGTFVFLYYAELVNKDIHPNIENYYNYFFVKDVQSLMEVSGSPSFEFNTRIVKYILKLEENDFSLLLSSMNKKMRQKLFALAVSNNYHTIDEYKTNLDNINHSLTNKNTNSYGYQFTERPA
ncbi:phosphoribosyltransferase family protein [Flavobacterium sp. MFBS3-15]|uniref:phosphoribosyltransferase family protein n=1 Tax=Flavobacterium sp. MFBS3-15 TaxID=2989816 RepID=UPI00223614B4|nr:phosphoribosyltransferase family protein [Flavobacterium sp. MFBS3-15]MCW4467740.1 phosphoribosyltransferase family protein [Flavobacterium sp. MFBS3-15]